MKFYCLSTLTILFVVVEMNFVESILDTKYDFSFDGNQGKNLITCIFLRTVLDLSYQS